MCGREVWYGIASTTHPRFFLPGRGGRGAGSRANELEARARPTRRSPDPAPLQVQYSQVEDCALQELFIQIVALRRIITQVERNPEAMTGHDTHAGQGGDRPKHTTRFTTLAA